MSSEAAALVQLFNDRWNGHDLDGVLACIDDEIAGVLLFRASPAPIAS